ncbi:MAG: hypothetical protein KF856_13555 [Cyclobacteriaceae bacterium]|nr:hypothetical protein [Cyclobacteriaceae bacterium]
MFDNLQFWIWLIVIVVTLIARANKKKPQPGHDQPEFGGTQENKPISFEDLLREIQASKAPAKPAEQPVYKPVSQSQQVDYVDYDDELEEEEKPLEQTNYGADDEIYTTYEKAKSDAFNRASLEETMHVEDTVVSYEKFKGYKRERKKPLASSIVKELRNPTSFKKAFILSEILTKRF